MVDVVAMVIAAVLFPIVLKLASEDKAGRRAWLRSIRLRRAAPVVVQERDPQ